MFRFCFVPFVRTTFSAPSTLLDKAFHVFVLRSSSCWGNGCPRGVPGVVMVVKKEVMKRRSKTSGLISIFGAFHIKSS